jgi:hypothetical protein
VYSLSRYSGVLLRNAAPVCHTRCAIMMFVIFDAVQSCPSAHLLCMQVASFFDCRHLVTLLTHQFACALALSVKRLRAARAWPDWELELPPVLGTTSEVKVCCRARVLCICPPASNNRSLHTATHLGMSMYGHSYISMC